MEHAMAARNAIVLGSIPSMDARSVRTNGLGTSSSSSSSFSSSSKFSHEHLNHHHGKQSFRPSSSRAGRFVKNTVTKSKSNVAVFAIISPVGSQGVSGGGGGQGDAQKMLLANDELGITSM